MLTRRGQYRAANPPFDPYTLRTDELGANPSLAAGPPRKLRTAARVPPGVVRHTD